MHMVGGLKDRSSSVLPAQGSLLPEEDQRTGHRQRLRDRFASGGAEALPDYELLELVLFSAIPRRDTKPLAKRLLARFGSFAEVVNAPPERLKEVKGVGDAAVLQLKLVRAGALRLMQGGIMQRPVLASWTAVLDYCRAAMGFEAREQFRILFLDKKNSAYCGRSAARGHRRPHARICARSGEKGAGTLCQRHHSGPQSPFGRPHSLPGRHRYDPADC